jgi:hypothetical protein
VTDNWKHRSPNMACRTCMYFVPKDPAPSDSGAPVAAAHVTIGRCRKNAPTMNGFPVVFKTDWCGQHKLDENKI